MSTPTVENLFQDGYLIDLHISKWSAMIGLRKFYQDLNVDPTLWNEGVLGGGVVYLLDKNIRQMLNTFESRARTLLAENSFMFGQNGRFVPANAFTDVVDGLEKLQTEFNAALDEYMGGYDNHKDDFLNSHKNVKLKNGSVVDLRATLEKYYPSALEVRNKFDFTYFVYKVMSPGSSAGQKVFEELNQKLNNQVGTFVEEVTENLREQITSSLSNFGNIVKKNGKMSGRSIDAVISAIDKFKKLNFVGDKEFEEKLEKFKNDHLVKLDPKDINIKKDDINSDSKVKFRKSLAATIDSVIVSSLLGTKEIGTRYCRKISLGGK